MISEGSCDHVTKDWSNNAEKYKLYIHIENVSTQNFADFYNN